MSLLRICILLVAVFGIVALAEKPTLVVSKSIETKAPTPNSDILVSVRIFNVGSGAAHSVLVKDDSWPEANFTISHGTTLASFDKILPGTNVTHNYVVRASKPGKYPTEPAYIYYSLTPGGQQNQNAISSHMGLIRVWRANEVERKSAPHFREWGVFSLLALGSIAFPLIAYLQIAFNYEKGVPKALLTKSKRA